jgi:hypothetical protein
MHGNRFPAAILAARSARRSRRAAMKDGLGARRHRTSSDGRQLLVAAYLPVIAFTAVLITPRMSRTRRRVRPIR